MESIAYNLRKSGRIDLPLGCLSKAGLILASQGEPFRGKTLMRALLEDGFTRSEVEQTLLDLMRMELFYAPHEVELE